MRSKARPLRAAPITDTASERSDEPENRAATSTTEQPHANGLHAEPAEHQASAEPAEHQASAEPAEHQASAEPAEHQASAEPAEHRSSKAQQHIEASAPPRHPLAAHGVAAEGAENGKATASCEQTPEPAVAASNSQRATALPASSLLASDGTNRNGQPAPDAAENATAVFRKLVEALRTSRPELAAFFAHAHPLQINRREIVLGLDRNSVLLATLEKRESVEALKAIATWHFGETPTIRFSKLEGTAGIGETLAQERVREQVERTKAAIQQARQHPLVVETARVLGGRIKEVRLSQNSS